MVMVMVTVLQNEWIKFNLKISGSDKAWDIAMWTFSSAAWFIDPYRSKVTSKANGKCNM